jgi:hypothetical protein
MYVSMLSTPQITCEPSLIDRPVYVLHSRYRYSYMYVSMREKNRLLNVCTSMYVSMREKVGVMSLRKMYARGGIQRAEKSMWQENAGFS